MEGNIQAPQTLHRYRYVGANPVSLWDPTGHGAAVEDELLDNYSITFTKHAAKHIADASISQSELEGLVQSTLREILASGKTYVGSQFWGWVELNGVPWIYRVFVVTSAWVNVGTAYRKP